MEDQALVCHSPSHLKTRLKSFSRYYSPYPLTEGEEELPASASVNQSFQKVPGVSRVTTRAHGRTSDLLSGGLLRQYGTESTLWVCHFCFKYMVDGVPWEMHKVWSSYHAFLTILNYSALV